MKLSFPPHSVMAAVAACCLWTAALPERAAAQATPAPPATPPTAAASPAPSTPPPIPEDPKITKRAQAEFLAWQSGTVDKSLYTPAMNDAVSDVVIGNISPQLKAVGGFKSIEYVAGGHYQGVDVYIYVVTCADGKMGMRYAIDPAGKVAGLLFRPVK